MATQIATPISQDEIPPFRGATPRGKASKFLTEYLRDFSIGAAAKRAGYSTKWADVHGGQMIRKYRPYLDWLRAIQAKENAKKIAVQEEDVLLELQKLAFSNMQDYVVVETVGGKKEYRFKKIDELTRDQAAAIKSMTLKKDGSVTYELYDKGVELFKLGRHLGLFNDRLIHEHRHKHMHYKADLSQVPMDVLESIERELEKFLPSRVIEG